MNNVAKFKEHSIIGIKLNSLSSLAFSARRASRRNSNNEIPMSICFPVFNDKYCPSFIYLLYFLYIHDTETDYLLKENSIGFFFVKETKVSKGAANVSFINERSS